MTGRPRLSLADINQRNEAWRMVLIGEFVEDLMKDHGVEIVRQGIEAMCKERGWPCDELVTLRSAIARKT
jgi:hypothetical protein